MGATDSALYWWPSRLATSSRETVDLGMAWSKMDAMPSKRRRVQSEGGDLRIYTQNYGATHGIRLVSERFSDDDLACDLEAVVAHLSVGGLIGATLTQAKSWAGWLKQSVKRGDTVLYVGLTDWYGGGTPVAGDYVTIESAHPQASFETCKITSVTTQANRYTLTLTDPLRYRHSTEPVLVRSRDFWPCLRLPADSDPSQILTTDYRINYTFEVELETDPAAILDYKRIGLDAMRQVT